MKWPWSRKPQVPPKGLLWYAIEMFLPGFERRVFIHPAKIVEGQPLVGTGPALFTKEGADATLAEIEKEKCLGKFVLREFVELIE